MGLPVSNSSGCRMVWQKLPSPPLRKTFRTGRDPSGIIELTPGGGSGEGINVDELSDVQQDDFDLEAFLSRRQVLVMTPEKCLYLLRHSPEVTDTLVLLLFAEGPQFDS